MTLASVVPLSAPEADFCALLIAHAFDLIEASQRIAGVRQINLAVGIFVGEVAVAVFIYKGKT